MGQKVNPIGLRVGVIRDWESRWYAKNKAYIENLQEDHKLRKYIKNKLRFAGVARTEIERTSEKIKVMIFTSRPGVVIGKKGAGLDVLKAELQKQTKNEIFVEIQEVRKPDMNAQLIAENVAMQLEKRVSWRRALKKVIASALRGGVRGIKVMVSGRLDGAEIARTEWYTEKSIPLHTLRADIDYATAKAKTTYGIIGIKVWVYLGNVMSQKEAGRGVDAQS